MKKEYTKPTAKVVEWDFNEAVCSTTVYNASLCIKIDDPFAGTARIDHRSSSDANSITWNRWNESGSN